MKSLLSELSRLIEIADKHRRAYWWTPPTSASARRSYEAQNTCPVIMWTDGIHDYTASYEVRCSCRNVYASGSYTKDGKKTTLTAIRNSYRRMAAAAGTV